MNSRLRQDGDMAPLVFVIDENAPKNIKLTYRASRMLFVVALFVLAGVIHYSTNLTSYLRGEETQKQMDNTQQDHENEENQNEDPNKPFFEVNPRPGPYIPSLRSRPSCVVAVHIPKTGGSYLKHTLFGTALTNKLNWTVVEWYPLFQNHGPGTLPSQVLADNHERMTDFVHGLIHIGHFTPSFLDWTDTSPKIYGNVSSTKRHCLTMTILREPVDRVISAFYFHRHNTSQWHNALFEDTDPLHCEYQNDMVRQLSNHGLARHASLSTKKALIKAMKLHNETKLHQNSSFLEDELQDNATIDQKEVKALVGWNHFDYDAYDFDVEAKHLAAAKWHLKNSFDIVCFLDRLEECTQSIFTSLGMQKSTNNGTNVDMDEDGKRNQGIHRRNATVTDEIKGWVRETNPWDIKLYSWALKEFRKTT